MKKVTVTYKDDQGKEHTETALGSDSYTLMRCLEDDGMEIIKEEWTNIK